jgi:hypothetical protein
MSDSMRNTVIAGCGVAVVCLVLGFLVGMSAGTPVEEPYFVSTIHPFGNVLDLVRHNRQTGKTEYSRVYPTRDTNTPPDQPWKTVPD